MMVSREAHTADLTVPNAKNWDKPERPCGVCGKWAHMRPDGLLYDRFKRVDGSLLFDRHMCARPR